MRRKVKELMSAATSLAVVSEDSTLFEAILSIGVLRNQNASLGLGLRCPAALVSNGDHTITGFLDFRNLLKSLEPKYEEIAGSVEKRAISPGWLKSELQKYGLWANALDDICKKAGELVIKNMMTVPVENQITDANASLNEAVFQMVVTGNDYLFVRNGEMLAGIICLSDILTHICDTVKACRI